MGINNFQFFWYERGYGNKFTGNIAAILIGAIGIAAFLAAFFLGLYYLPKLLWHEFKNEANDLTITFLFLGLFATWAMMCIAIKQVSKFINRKQKLTPDDLAYLNKNVEYYRNLNTENKAKFIKRISYHYHKKFVPYGMDVIEHETKLLIAAAATIVTFGFEDYRLSHFSIIGVTPREYASGNSKYKFQGETRSRRGMVILSAKHIHFGFENETDGLNIGIHEFAHALYVQLKTKGGKHIKWMYQIWVNVAKTAIPAMKQGKITFFRDYASANKDELFACAVEAFFEQSEQFQKVMPKLYDVMVRSLKQNPINKKDPTNI